MDALTQHRLLQHSQQLRTDAVRNRLELAETFCRVAETQGRWNRADQAEETLAKVNRALEEIGRHLHEPAYVSPKSLPDLERLRYRLQRRANSLSLSLS